MMENWPDEKGIEVLMWMTSPIEKNVGSLWKGLNGEINSGLLISKATKQF